MLHASGLSHSLSFWLHSSIPSGSGCKPQENSTDGPTKVKCSCDKQGASTDTEVSADISPSESKFPLRLEVLEFSCECAMIRVVLYMGLCPRNSLTYSPDWETLVQSSSVPSVKI